MDLQRACELAAIGMPQRAVANALGISESTLARKKAADPEFAEAYDKAFREGHTDWRVRVSRSMLDAIKKGHTGPLLAAWELLQREFGENQAEKPLLLEVPLADGSMLYVPEGCDPIAAAEHAENVLKIPEWEFPTRDDMGKVSGT
jgi:hypothetical protein